MSESHIVVSSASGEPSSMAVGTFTGEVWRDTVITRQNDIGIADVFFTPGSRTFWHTHEHGQILCIRSGVGYVGDESGTIRVSAGDTGWTPPGVRHWHGAVSDRALARFPMGVG